MMCFRESLRIEPPVNFSSSHLCTRDVILAKGTPKELKLSKGQTFNFLFNLMHHNEEQWGPEHDKYIPERFDPSSKYYKRPDGKPRSHHAFTPFLGGARICLGKTFAETVAKKMISLILKFYELEHCDTYLKKKVALYDLW